ncbi:serine/threonine-protein kinase [Microbacterium sp. Marseille-Q6965]|uniref:serine/threonine-protein kinase n=1 Tax=Microbacterium sp. Marseille-Q6965 TaxID=2965072 RepID=UPI0021B757F1|nr:serine/threonine-protein kinase [Microbacterium sp. Marseille-Q6965]
MTSPAPESTAPLLEGRYQLSECVGAGGMATVYRAHDIALGRTVAVKMMRTGLEAGGVRSARSESAALASLNHPGLVTLYDARFAAEGPEYLVMEYVEGPTLSERIRRGPLPPEDVADLGAELAEALHAVHAAGVVHRDVKPSNVLLAPSGRPGRAYRAKLADFGIAYLLGQERLTSPGVVIGTLSYLAPEQLRGAAPTPAADIYALGLVLLEALTGSRAFPSLAPHESLAARHALTVEIPDTLPAGWARLLRRMTADDPAARPSATEVALEARAIAAPGPETARTLPTRQLAADPIEHVPATLPLPHTTPISAPPPAKRPPRRRARRTAAVLALAAAAAAVGAAFTIEGLAPTQAPAVTEPSVVPEDSRVVPPGTAQDGEGSDPAPSTGTNQTDNGGEEQASDPVTAVPPASGNGGAAGQTAQDKAGQAQQKAAERAADAQQKAEEKAQEAQQKAAEQARKDAEKRAEETGNDDDAEEAGGE